MIIIRDNRSIYIYYSITKSLPSYLRKERDTADEDFPVDLMIEIKTRERILNFISLRSCNIKYQNGKNSYARRQTVIFQEGT